MQVSDSYYKRLAEIESSNNPQAISKQSGAAGLYQFMPNVAKEFGIDPLNQEQSERAVRQLTERNRKHLISTLGREPSYGELYLAHQQGATGASRLLASPDKLAASVRTRKAIEQNGGNLNMTSGQFADKWTSKFSDLDGSDNLVGNAGGDLIDGEWQEIEVGDEIFEFPANMSLDEIKVVLDKHFAEKPNALESGIIGAAGGFSFNTSDEMMAGLSTPVAWAGLNMLGKDVSFGQVYDNILKRNRDNQKEAREANPKSYLAGEVTGAIGNAAATLPVLAARAPALANFINKGWQGGQIARTLTLAGKAAAQGKRTLTVAGTAGVQGGISGFGSGEGSAGERLEKAGGEALASAVVGNLSRPIGAAIGGAAPYAGRVANGVANRGRKLINWLDKGKSVAGSTAGSASNISGVAAGKTTVDAADAFSEKAAKKAEKILAKEAKSKGLNLGGDFLHNNKSLLEETAGNLDDIAQGAATYGSGNQKLSKFFTEKALPKARNDVKRAVKKSLGGVDDTVEYIESLKKSASEYAEDLYSKTHNEFIDEGSKIFDDIGVQRAIKEVRAGNIGSEIADVPDHSVKTLDYVTRALRDKANKLSRDGLTAESKAVRSTYNKIMAEVPNSLKKARHQAAEYLRPAEMLENGRKFDSSTLKIDQLRANIKRMNPKDLAAYKKGVNARIQEHIANVVDNGDLYKKVMGKEISRERLKAILPKKEYEALEIKLKSVGGLNTSYVKILGNSSTANKQNNSGQLKAEVQEIGEALASGGTVSAVARTIKGVAKKLFRMSGEREADRVSLEVAKILTERDPVKKAAIFYRLSGEKIPRHLNRGQAKMVQRAVAEIEMNLPPRSRAALYGAWVVANVSGEDE